MDLVKARLTFEVEIELDVASHYPPEVTSWKEAADYDAATISLTGSSFDVGPHTVAVEMLTDKPFDREGGT